MKRGGDPSGKCKDICSTGARYFISEQGLPWRMQPARTSAVLKATGSYSLFHFLLSTTSGGDLGYNDIIMGDIQQG